MCTCMSPTSIYSVTGNELIEVCTSPSIRMFLVSSSQKIVRNYGLS